MRKIRLDLSDLQVDSFATHGRDGRKDTVRAHQACASYFPCDSAVAPKDTFDDWTCGNTCNHTCAYSCPGTCNWDEACGSTAPKQGCADTDIPAYHTCGNVIGTGCPCNGGGATGVACLQTEQ